MTGSGSPNSITKCSTCTRRLVVIAYKRAPWFRVIREPLKFTMRHWVRLYGIDVTKYEVRSASCYDCTRFRKNVLKERSALFRLFNRVVNPVFDAILERVVKAEEVQKAKAHARAATSGEALTYDGDVCTQDALWKKV